MERCIAWTSPANQMILSCLGQWNIDWRCCELLGKCSLLPCPIMPRISWLFLDPLFFGNVARHAYFKFMLLTFYSDPTTTDTIFKSICISNTFCSFAGSGWPWLSLIPRFHNMALRRAVGDGTSKLPRGSMLSWVAAWTTLDVQPFSTSMWIGGKSSQASQHTGGERLEYTSLTA